MNIAKALPYEGSRRMFSLEMSSEAWSSATLCPFLRDSHKLELVSHAMTCRKSCGPGRAGASPISSMTPCALVSRCAPKRRPPKNSHKTADLLASTTCNHVRRQQAFRKPHPGSFPHSEVKALAKELEFRARSLSAQPRSREPAGPILNFPTCVSRSIEQDATSSCSFREEIYKQDDPA